ncbi:MAG TPA: hypothetical protein VFE71_10330 [Bacteroidales bacterium]|nr:hypothetical protein [Bacteroidales bacterium]
MPSLVLSGAKGRGGVVFAIPIAIGTGGTNLINGIKLSLIDFGSDDEVVRVAKGNRGPTRIYFAKQPEILSGPSSLNNCLAFVR